MNRSGNHASAVLGLLAAGLMLAASSATAKAGSVEGKLLNPDGQPAANRQVHFDNLVTGDLFLVHSGKDGRFSLYLPSGSYDLRKAHGRIIAGRIEVGHEALTLGTLTVPAPNLALDLIEWEGLGEAVVQTPAPSTANVPAPGLLRKVAEP